jgi:hypothetical protein
MTTESIALEWMPDLPLCSHSDVLGPSVNENVI